jgi:hypothetical protein
VPLPRYEGKLRRTVREGLSSAMGRVSRENISEKTLLKLLGIFVISRKSRFPWL